jgi:hypothetical protein
MVCWLRFAQVPGAPDGAVERVSGAEFEFDLMLIDTQNMLPSATIKTHRPDLKREQFISHHRIVK